MSTESVVARLITGTDAVMAKKSGIPPLAVFLVEVITKKGIK